MQAVGYSQYTCLYIWVSASKQPADLPIHLPSCPLPPCASRLCPVYHPQHVLPGPLRLLTARTAALKDFSMSCLSLTLALRRSSASFLDDACVRGGRRNGVVQCTGRWSCVSQDMCVSRNVCVTCWSREHGSASPVTVSGWLLRALLHPPS